MDLELPAVLDARIWQFRIFGLAGHVLPGVPDRGHVVDDAEGDVAVRTCLECGDGRHQDKRDGAISLW